MKISFRQPAGLIATAVLIALAMSIIPTEQKLGSGLRLILLHGAWAWAGLTAFGASAVSGGAGLLFGQAWLHRLSVALGRTGLVFLLTYLPFSLLVMEINWGGLYLDEPRWRIPMIFAVAGILLQVGMSIMNLPRLSSIGNFIFGTAFLFQLMQAENVLHPDSPVSQSSSSGIIVGFALLLSLSLFAAAQTVYWWYGRLRK